MTYVEIIQNSLKNTTKFSQRAVGFLLDSTAELI